MVKIRLISVVSVLMALLCLLPLALAQDEDLETLKKEIALFGITFLFLAALDRYVPSPAQQVRTFIGEAISTIRPLRF